MATAISPAAGRVTSRYGARSTGIAGASTYHRGVDIAPPTPGQTGVPVRAPYGGTVATVTSSSARGTHVIIRHSATYSTLHQHLAKATVKPGQKIRIGQQIGVMGATGIAAGIHLHTEVWKDGQPVDPTPWYAARHAVLGSAGTPGTYETTAAVWGRRRPVYGVATRRVLRRKGKRLTFVATTPSWGLTQHGTFYPLKKSRRIT